MIGQQRGLPSSSFAQDILTKRLEKHVLAFAISLNLIEFLGLQAHTVFIVSNLYCFIPLALIHR